MVCLAERNVIPLPKKQQIGKADKRSLLVLVRSLLEFMDWISRDCIYLMIYLARWPSYSSISASWAFKIGFLLRLDKVVICCWYSLEYLSKLRNLYSPILHVQP